MDKIVLTGKFDWNKLNKFEGFPKGNTGIICGTTASGKSTTAAYFAAKEAMKGLSVLVAAFEYGGRWYCERLEEIIKNRFQFEFWAKARNSIAVHEFGPIGTIDEIESAIQSKNYNVLVIDGFDFMVPFDDMTSRFDDMTSREKMQIQTYNKLLETCEDRNMKLIITCQIQRSPIQC